MKGSRPLNSNEIKRLKGFFRGKMGVRNKAMFLIGANTGFRVSELLSLTIGDVLDRNGKIKDRITVAKSKMKGNKSGRQVLLCDAAQNALKPLLKSLNNRGFVLKTDPIFMSIRGTGAIGRIQAWKVLKKAYDTAGLTGQLGTHTMRKIFANNVYDYLMGQAAAGVKVDPFRVTSKALGHHDIKCTDHYLSFKTEMIDRAIQAVGV